jgi:phage gp29-like protein
MAKPDLNELGTTGLRRSGGFITEEFLNQLRGRRGLLVYREMADNDPVIGSILYAIEKVVLRLEWRVDPFDDSPQAEELQKFVDECLEDMSDSWDQTLASILSMLVYGFSFHEIVYKIRGGDVTDPKKKSKYSDGKIGWRKFPIRSQETLNNWMMDIEGGIQGFRQIDPTGGGFREVPIDKGLLFRTTVNKNNPEGRSLLRNCFRPWYYKRRIEEIEAIGIERDLAGLPVAKVPPEYLSSGATAAQKGVLAEITTIVQNIKRNEQEGVIFPMMYDENGKEMFSLELLSSGGSRQFDTDKVISRYDQRISMSVLSDFILLGHEKVGSFALGSQKMDLWTMSVEAIAKSIAEVMNQYAIPRLLKLNGMDTELTPFLTYGEVSSVDLNELGNYVQKLIGAGALTPDEKLEAYLREQASLPPAENLVD